MFKNLFKLNLKCTFFCRKKTKIYTKIISFTHVAWSCDSGMLADLKQYGLLLLGTSSHLHIHNPVIKRLWADTFPNIKIMLPNQCTWYSQSNCSGESSFTNFIWLHHEQTTYYNVPRNRGIKYCTWFCDFMQLIFLLIY